MVSAKLSRRVRPARTHVTLGIISVVAVGAALILMAPLVGRAAPPSYGNNFNPQTTMRALGLNILLNDRFDGLNTTARIASVAAADADRAVYVVCPSGGFPATSAVPPPGCETIGTDSSGTPVGSTGDEAYEFAWNIPASLDGKTRDFATYHCMGAPAAAEPGGNCTREVETDVLLDDGQTSSGPSSATLTEYCVDANKDNDCADKNDVDPKPLDHGELLPDVENQFPGGQLLVGARSSSDFNQLALCMDFNASGGTAPNSCDSATFDQGTPTPARAAGATYNDYSFPVTPPSDSQLAFFLHPAEGGSGPCADLPGCLMDNIFAITTTEMSSPSPSVSPNPSPSPSPTPTPSPSAPPSVECELKVSGVLGVTGTEGPDNIEIRPKEGSNLELEVVVNGEVKCTFFNSDVESIVVSGRGGDDTIVVSDEITKRTLLFGDDGNDTIRGGGGTSAINGGEGNDTLTAGPGDDYLNGGNGADTMGGKGGDDTYDDPDGGDEVIDIDGNNTIRTGPGADTIKAGPGNDEIKGGAGPDTIKPGAGANEVDGGEGNDSILDEIDEVFVPARASSARKDKSHDVFDGGPGDDRIIAGGSTDTVIGGPGNDHLRGGKDDDVLKGNGGRDNLDGQGGRDRLAGGKGNDTLRGGAGSGDRCNGGPGRDRIFVGGAEGCESFS